MQKSGINPDTGKMINPDSSKTMSPDTNKMMNPDSLRCALIVDCERIRKNLLELKRLAQGRKVLCTVKANAYGHGMVGVAEAIRGLTDYFAVATPEEGIVLRRAIGDGLPILILGPVSPAVNADTLRFGITQTVFDLRRARALNDCAASFFGSNDTLRLKEPMLSFHDHRAHIHIAVDTGMSRIGLSADQEGLETIKEIMKLPCISVDGIFTHFAVADQSDLTPTYRAYESFRDFKKLCQNSGIDIPIWHAANTAGVINSVGTDSDMDMVRLGIGLYGLYPSDEIDRSKADLLPASLWYSFISMVKDIPAGTSVSYGYRFTAKEKMRIGTVSCGYADGFVRARSNKGFVLVNGVRCPVIGTICMDQFMVDLSDVPEAEAGDKVILMGEGISADEIAREANTISYEIICGIAARVPRIYTLKDTDAKQRENRCQDTANLPISEQEKKKMTLPRARSIPSSAGR